MHRGRRLVCIPTRLQLATWAHSRTFRMYYMCDYSWTCVSAFTQSRVNLQAHVCIYYIFAHTPSWMRVRACSRTLTLTTLFKFTCNIKTHMRHVQHVDVIARFHHAHIRRVLGCTIFHTIISVHLAVLIVIPIINRLLYTWLIHTPYFICWYAERHQAWQTKI